jgi:hypothetical protein
MYHEQRDDEPGEGTKRPPIFVRRVSSMAAVSSVHEQMDHRAQQQERVGQRAEQVCAMLLPEEEGRDCEKEAQCPRMPDKGICCSIVTLTSAPPSMKGK